MIKTITAIGAAALIAALALVLPGMSVSANTPDAVGAQQPAAKGDRLAIHALGDACSQRAWPYYDRNCLFEARWQGDANDAHKVRLVTTDRF